MHTPMDHSCVHDVRALCPGSTHSAVSWHALGRNVAMLDRVSGRVAARNGHVAGPSVMIQTLDHNTGPYLGLCRSLCRACRSAPMPCRMALLCCIETPNGRPLATIQHLHRDSPASQALRARAAACPCTQPAMSWPMLAVSWGHVAGPPCHVVAPFCTP